MSLAIVQRLRGVWRRIAKLVVGFVLGVLATAGFAFGLPFCRAGQGQAFALHVAVPSSGPGLASAVFQTLGAPLQPGHRVTLLENGAVFDALVADIAHARTSVHIVMYIWEAGRASDRLSAALIERARAGVACRLVIDDFGSSDFAKTIQPALSAAGCDVRLFRPGLARDALARNHRKIAVIDGAIAYTGGFGVRDNWLGDGLRDDAWRDSNVRFTGPAVRDAQQAFAENWQEAGGPLLPDAAFPAPDTSGPALAAFVTSTASPVVTRAERLSQLVIAAASRRLWITNAYLVPSRAIFAQLLAKARAGVDVRILVPGSKSDSKPALAVQHKEYPELLAAGVRVWEYTPAMVHAKTMIADDELAVVGSINLDTLSLNKLEESALVIADRALTAELARHFEADLQHAHELTR